MNVLLARTLLLLAASTTVLGACGGLKSHEAATVTYNLRAAAAAANPAPPAANRLKPFSLQVVSPVAGPGLETDAILLTGSNHRLDRYASSLWAAPAPRLLGNLALETLRNHAVLGTVHDDASPFPSDYILRISIRRFDADYGGDPAAAPTATVVLDCVVGTRGERKVLATFVAQAAARSADNRMSAVVDAFEQATQEALGKLADQTLTAIAADVTSH